MIRDGSCEDSRSGPRARLDSRSRERSSDSARAESRDLDRLARELSLCEAELRAQNEDLRRTQVALERSRDRYRELYDMAPVGYLSLDHRGQILDVNATSAALLGDTKGHLLGSSLAAFLSREDADVLHHHLRAVFRHGTKQGCDVRLRAPQGRAGGERPTLRVIHIDSIATIGDHGPLATCRSVLIDLTALRSAQDDLLESESRFGRIAEHMRDALLMVDRATRTVTYTNPATETMFGSPLPGPDLEGSWRQHLHPDDRDRMWEAYERYMGGGSFDEVFRVHRAGTEIRWLRARMFPIVDEDGCIRRDVAMIQDITVQRRLEDELRHAHKMEAVGALASGVAHDFNNVLQAILGCINVARRVGTEAQCARRFLDRAAHAARRGGELADQLMAFSRKQDDAPRPLELDPVLLMVGDLLERLVTERISVVLDLHAPGAAIHADPVQIEQIFLNLAANARDAIRGPGTLTIRSSTLPAARARALCQRELDDADRYLRIEVEDTGTGMDAATRARVFEPFFTTKAVGRGTGLGLSTVFAVVRKLGGCIDVESEPGQGTRFTLWFPVCDTKVRPREPTSPHLLGRFRGTALLVEDDALVRVTVRHHLEELGLTVIEASGEAEAFGACDRHEGPIELLVCDVVLPRMWGPELAQSIAARYPGVHVVLMSASPELMDDGQTSAPVLQKPFGVEELARVLARLMTIMPVSSPVPAAESAPGPAAPIEEVAVDPNAPCIVLVEDEPSCRHVIDVVFREKGYRMITAASAVEAFAAVEQHDGPIDLLVTDVRLPGTSGVELAERLRASYPSLRVVFMSGLLDPPTKAEAFVRKPIDLDNLIDVIERTLAAK